MRSWLGTGRYKSPFELYLRGSLNKEHVLNVDARRKVHEKTWKDCCTLMSNGWTDHRGISILNFLVHSNEGSFYLYSIDALIRRRLRSTWLKYWRMQSMKWRLKMWCR